MKAPLLILALVLGLSAALAACEDGEEEIVTTTASVTPTSIATATPTPAPSPTPEPTPAPTVPPDWKAYTDPEGLFSVKYPPSWFADHGTFSTFQLGSVGPTFPPGAIKIDVGAVNVDQLGSCATPAAGAITTTAGGHPGWRTEQDGGEVAGHSIQVFVEGDAYCYGILALFANDVKQYSVFDQFLAGLTLEK